MIALATPVRPRPPLARARPFVLGLLSALVVATAGARAPEVRDRALVAGVGPPALRVRALERLVCSDENASLLLETLEREADPLVRERALALAPGRLAPAEVARLLALRLDRARVGEPATLPATLVDLRAAGAQGDERALGPIARLLSDSHARRAEDRAALTALGAIATRRGLCLERLPHVSLSAARVGELAASLDEDAAPWRVAVVRALARRVPLEPRILAHLRARARASLDPEPGDCGENEGALDLLLLRGDHATLAGLPVEASDRAGLLAPLACLVERPDARDLDRVLALEAWGGRGAWRRLEALTSRASGRAALSAALERAPRPRRPAAAATALLLARQGSRELSSSERDSSARDSWERDWPDLDDPAVLERLGAAGALESLPPPLVEAAVHRGGARAAAALARALGREDGELAFVLEPGAGDPAHVFLTDLAVEAFSTPRSRER